MIYGEELKPIDFSKGLWLESGIDGVPEGYAANLVNLIPNKNGMFQARPNFLPLTSRVNCTQVLTGFNTARVAIGNQRIPPYDQYYTARAFHLEAPSGYPYNPTVLIQVLQQNPAGTITYQYSWMSQNNTANTWSSTTPVGILLSMCAYRDRVYCLEGGQIGASVVMRYDFSLNTITRTTAATPSLSFSQIITFRDRIFAVANKTGLFPSRVYYTEQASVGGYPENWNSGNNFFDLPDSGATIWNMFVHNDRLYLFTNIGVYIVVANGTPSNWQVELLSRDLRVYEEDHVSLINGIFFFTDTKNIFAYNGGTTITTIGDPIAHAFSSKVYDFDIPIAGSVQTFNGPSGFRIYPFLDGILIQLSYYTTGSGFYTQTRTSKYYYYSDMGIWSEIRFDTDNSGSNRDHYSILLSGRSRQLKTAAGETDKYTDYIVDVRLNGTTSTWIAELKSVRLDNQDIDLWNYQFDMGLFTCDKTLGSFFTLSRLKELRARLYSTLTSTTFTPYTDGSANTSYVPLHTSPGGQYRERIPVSNQRAFDAALSIKATMNKTSGPGADQSLQPYPSFRLSPVVYAVVNTDTRNDPRQESL